MRTIAWLIFASVALAQQTQVSTKSTGACELSVTAAGKMPEGVLAVESGSAARVHTAVSEMAPYIDAGHATYSTDVVAKTVTWAFKVNRHPVQKLEGTVLLESAADSSLAGTSFQAAVTVAPGKGCPEMFAKTAPVQLTTSQVHLSVVSIGKNLWQVAGLIDAAASGSGQVTVRGDGWSQAISLANKPVPVSQVFYSTKKARELGPFEVVETSTQALLTKVTPELTEAGQSSISFVDWAALALAALAIGAAILMWMRSKQLTGETVDLRREFSELPRFTPQPQPIAKPAPVLLKPGVSEEALSKLRQDLDARLASMLSAVRESGSWKDSIGDVGALRIPGAQASAAPRFAPEDYFCAVVNDWFASQRSGSRAAVVGKLKQTGFTECWLASLEGIDEARQDPTNPLRLTPGDDGWWVLASSGGQEYFACPLDSRYLSQGNLSLVQRWYTGLASGSKPLVYLERPAVVRQVKADCYELKAEGSLSYTTGAGPTLQTMVAAPNRGGSRRATLVEVLVGVHQKLTDLEQQLAALNQRDKGRADSIDRITAKLDDGYAKLASESSLQIVKLRQEIRRVEQQIPVSLPAVTPVKTMAAAVGASAVITPVEIPAPEVPEEPVESVAWSAIFDNASADSDAEPGSTQSYLARLKQIAAMSDGQIIRAVRRDNLVAVLPFPDPNQIPADRNVYLMVVGRLLKNGCWEVVLPKGEIPVDSAANVLAFLLSTPPASNLEVKGVVQPAVWEPRGTGFGVKQYLQLA